MYHLNHAIFQQSKFVYITEIYRRQQLNQRNNRFLVTIILALHVF